MKVTVSFMYYEEAQKWEAFVEGTENPIEARQAFSAVVLTCQTLNPDLLIHSKVESTRLEPSIMPGGLAHHIIPAV